MCYNVLFWFHGVGAGKPLPTLSGTELIAGRQLPHFDGGIRAFLTP